ncbi:hypothetical protein HNV12_18020 [Methanococcoides sp. SA1]|nr:hypothetical protein [Methanococcoides sp. SA1]
MINVRVSVIVNPTEDQEKVARATRNMFPEIELEMHERKYGNFLVGEGDINSLKNIHDLFRKERIIDTARTQIQKNRWGEPEKTFFMLNKQVATIERLNFPAKEETLGSIQVEINADNEEAMDILMEWLTPPTEDGVPLFEPDMPEL